MMMKKLLAMLMLFCAFAYSNESQENVSEQTITNEYYYLGYDFAIPAISHPEVGYRYQKDSFGVDAHFGMNALEDDFFFANLGASFQYFLTPSHADQTFLGLDLSGKILTHKFKGEALHKWTSSSWSTDYFLAPSVFVGKDFSFASGNKIFGQVYYLPGSVQLNHLRWDWSHVFGFRVGYGF